MMPGVRRAALAALVVPAAVTALVVARRPSPAEAVAASEVLVARQVRDTDIAFYEARAAADPVGATDRAKLSALYLQRGRETGDYRDFMLAESLATVSLSMRGGRNAGALLIRASSLLAQHRFTESRLWAERLVAESDLPSHRALLGEIQLELGDYPAARRTFGSLIAERANLAVAPRLARLEELEGRPGAAHVLLTRARDLASRRSDLPLEQRAWFHLRVADLTLRHGRLAEAGEAIASGLAVNPGDARLLAARLRLAAQRQDWTAAREAAREALAAGPDIATRSLAGDVAAALGNCREARELWSSADSAYAEQPEPFARQWTLHRLQHGVALDSTRALLEREVRERPDALGWQLVGLARELTGDSAGAARARHTAATLVAGAGQLLRADTRSLDPGMEPVRQARQRCTP